MATRTLPVIAGTAVVLAVGGGWIAMRLDNAHVRSQLARLQERRQQAERLRDDNRQLQEIITRVQTDAAEGARAIHASVVQARTDVEELERKARDDYARLQADSVRAADNLANNRDPEKGLMRLEYFGNQGRATPAAAFQTFVWAAMKGEDATLAGMIAMDAAAREQGQAVVAALPPESQVKYPTAEKLAALFFAAALTAQPSAQVLEVSFTDAQHAIVQVRGLSDKTQRIPMQLGAEGWQIVVPVGMMERLGSWAAGGALSSRGK